MAKSKSGKKKKKLESNRFEDRVKDYVRTNSEYTDENKERAREAGVEKGWKEPLNSTEKGMIIVGIIAIIGIIIRYVIL